MLDEHSDPGAGGGPAIEPKPSTARPLDDDRVHRDAVGN
jgi:hypothetical protein